jgi:integrase
MTFNELSDKWLALKGHLDESSRNRYQHAIAGMTKHLGKLPRANDGKMTEFVSALARWQDDRRQSLAASSFNLELATLRSILDMGVRDGAMTRNPAAELRPSKAARVEQPIPTPDELARIVAEVRTDGGDEAADFIEFLAYSGCREDESRRLTWRDVEFDQNRLLVGRGGNTKNGREYYLPLFPKLKLLLLAIRAQRPDATADDLIFGGTPVRYRLDKATAKLNLPHLHHHSFRHYFAVQALRAVGMNKVGVVAKWLNHQDGGKLLLSLYGNHVTDAESQQLAAQLG